MVTRSSVAAGALSYRPPPSRTKTAFSTRTLRNLVTPARRYGTSVSGYGVATPTPAILDQKAKSAIYRSPFRFETGYALCAKRPTRPFPPPFLSMPSTSFSDPLTTHHQSQDKRLSVRGELVRGLNNGDDAVLVAENFIGVNDGVGAWLKKPHGHAA